LKSKEDFCNDFGYVKIHKYKYFVITRNVSSDNEWSHLSRNDEALIRFSNDISNEANFRRIVCVVNVENYDEPPYRIPYPMELPVGFIFANGEVFGEEK
jgi:hypothetical protein